jgi:hypothetical protein
MQYALMVPLDKDSAVYPTYGDTHLVCQLFGSDPGFADGLTVVQVADNVGLGWYGDPVDTANLQPPPNYTPQPPTVIAAIQFFDQLNDEEYTALRNTKEVVLQRFFDKIRLVGVRLNEDWVKEAKEEMVRYRIVSRERADKLFSPPEVEPVQLWKVQPR